MIKFPNATPTTEQTADNIGNALRHARDTITLEDVLGILDAIANGPHVNDPTYYRWITEQTNWSLSLATTFQTTCPRCDGEGFIEYATSPRFNSRAEQWYPGEPAQEDCPDCIGYGELENEAQLPEFVTREGLA